MSRVYYFTIKARLLELDDEQAVQPDVVCVLEGNLAVPAVLTQRSNLGGAKFLEKELRQPIHRLIHELLEVTK